MTEEAEFCTLYRRGGPPWKFHWASTVGSFNHITSRGTRYTLRGCDHYRGLWIARVCDGKWVSWERQLGADYILFSDGGQYFFDRDRSREL